MTPAFLIVDKPAGITSHDVVAAVRAVTGIKKVGHTGTLDPFATGVLPLALGPATRLIQYLDESLKVYDATVSLGSTTDTGDPTGEVVRELPVPPLDEAGVEEALAGFVGDRMQRPPAYSAVKVKGKPLYHYARRGEKVEAEARPITIHGMDLTELYDDELRVLISCSRGTYARVLADEIGMALGTAGHLSALMRPRSGPFFIEDAIDMPTLAGIVAGEPGHTWQEVLLSRSRGAERVPWRPRDQVVAALRPWLVRPFDALAHLPLADVRPTDARRIRNGATPPPAPAGVSYGERYLVVDGADLVAVAESTPRGPATLRVLPPDASPTRVDR